MPPSSRNAMTAPASDQGYKVIGDEELVAITEGRVRQLEGELAGHRGLLEEMEADPNQKENADDPNNAITSARAVVESLEARLKTVLHPRLDALRSNVKKNAKAKDEAGSAPTP